jgi:hypothetical protein
MSIASGFSTRTGRPRAAAATAQRLGWRLHIRTHWDARLRVAGVIVDCLGPCRAELPWERCAVVNVGEGGIEGPCDRVATDWRQVFDLVQQQLPGRRLGCAVFAFGGGSLSRSLYAEALLLQAETGGPPPLQVSGAADAPALVAWLRRHRPDAVLCADSTVPQLLRGCGVAVVRLDAVSRLDAAPGVDLQIEQRMVRAIDLLHARAIAGESGRPEHPVCVLVPGRWTGRPRASAAVPGH